MLGLIQICQDHQIDYVEYTQHFDFLYDLKKGEKFDLVIVDRFSHGFDALEDDFKLSCQNLNFHGPLVLYSCAVSSDEIVQGYDLVLAKHQRISKLDFHKIIQCTDIYKGELE